jgi:hypothetical protein
MADINISLGLIDNSFKQAMRAINAEISDTNKSKRYVEKSKRIKKKFVLIRSRFQQIQRGKKSK